MAHPTVRRRRAAPPARRPGFSLVELLIVLTIIGITTAMAYPKLRRAGHAADLRSAQSALAASVARTRAVAIQRARPARLYFTATSARTVVVEPSGALTLVGTPAEFTALFQVQATVLPASANTFIEFDARGIGVLTGGSGPVVRLDLVRDAEHTARFCVTRYGRILRAAELAAGCAA